MKIIILIIANDSPQYYLDMQAMWRKYMNNHPNITTYFIKSNPYLQQDILLNNDDNTIYIRGTESFAPGIFDKTIASIKYCLRTMDFDFIYRTNLSSFLDLNKMYDLFLSNKINYGGAIGNKDGIVFSSGCGFILSKEACIYLTENSRHNLYYLDDVVIGYILNKKYPPIQIGRNDISDIADPRLTNNPTNIFHFRCKSSGDHKETCQKMQILYSTIYGK